MRVEVTWPALVVGLRRVELWRGGGGGRRGFGRE